LARNPPIYAPFPGLIRLNTENTAGIRLESPGPIIADTGVATSRRIPASGEADRRAGNASFTEIFHRRLTEQTELAATQTRARRVFSPCKSKSNFTH
jgi:hypothetical protein